MEKSLSVGFPVMLLRFGLDIREKMSPVEQFSTEINQSGFEVSKILLDGASADLASIVLL